MKRFKLFVFVIAFCSLVPVLLYSQYVDTAWVRRYNGPGNSYDYAYAIAVDDAGNVFVTGSSTGSGTDLDYATTKYNSAGVEQWVQRYNGPANNEDWAYAIAIDGAGNVYITGWSAVSGTSDDYVTIKYNSTGETLWVRRYNGLGNNDDEASAIAVDGSGNVYVTGYSVDSGTYEDYATIKYNSNGETLWVRRYNGPGNSEDEASAIAVDGQGNVYVTGISVGSGTSFDYATIKYNSAGVQQWVARYNGLGNDVDMALSLAIDGQGNVYVTGYSYGSGTYEDYATIKYNTAGETLWVRRYNGPGNNDDEARVIAVDGSGNVYVTGYSKSSGTYEDYATIKYNTAGETLWVRRYNGPGNDDDEARAIAVDSSGSVYVTGLSWGSGAYDYATIKYNSVGVEQWVQRYNGPANDDDLAFAIAVDAEENVYVTGASVGSGTNYDYATIKYVQTQPGTNEIASLPLAKTSGVEVYPNPASLFFIIRSPLNAQGLTLRIFDVSGKIVRSEELKGKNNRVSLGGIKSGVYFVQIGDEGDEMVKEKLIVTR
jgi:uncharacterized delta-60 repeat protein